MFCLRSRTSGSKLAPENNENNEVKIKIESRAVNVILKKFLKLGKLNLIKKMLQTKAIKTYFVVPESK